MKQVIMKSDASDKTARHIQLRVVHPHAEIQPYARHIDKLAIPVRNGIRLVPYAQILFVEASGNYSIIHLNKDKKLLVCKTLKQFESRLGQTNFIRSHQSYLINTDHIEHVNTSAAVTLTNGSIVPVSRRQVATLKKYLLNKYSI